MTTSIEFSTSTKGRYGFLSNFAHSPLELPYRVEGRVVLVRAMSIEAEFHAAQYDPLPLDEGDIQVLKTYLQHAIRSAPTAMEASLLGRDETRTHDLEMSYHLRATLEPFRTARIRPREDWETIKDACMLFLLRKKFEYPQFRVPLLATNNAYLVFHCPRDLYWGTDHGMGKNRLGEMLMAVREEIRIENHAEAMKVRPTQF